MSLAVVAVVLGYLVAGAAIFVPLVLGRMGIGVRWLRRPVKGMFMWSGLVAFGPLTNAEECLEGSPECSEMSSFLGLGIMWVLGLGVLVVVWQVTR